MAQIRPQRTSLGNAALAEAIAFHLQTRSVSGVSIAVDPRASTHCALLAPLELFIPLVLHVPSRPPA